MTEELGADNVRSIDDASPSEWDRASALVEAWARANKPFPNDRGVKARLPMTVSQYASEAMRTAKRKEFVYDLLHAALGVASEAGEFTTSVKAHAIYGKPIDKENLIEELGDLCWFVALACEVLNVPLEDVMQANIDKLRKRYPSAYSDDDALARADKVI